MKLWPILLLIFAILGAGAQDATAQNPKGENRAEPAPRQDGIERHFLVFLGQPGLRVEIDGAVAGESDEEGLLRIRRTAAAGENLRFAVEDPRWRLAAERTVPEGDPSIPVYWDLAASLLRLPPPPSLPTASPPTLSAPTRSPVPPRSPAPPLVGRPRESAADPCRERRSLICQVEQWSRFNRAARDRDCTASLRTAERLMAEYPSFGAAAETRRAFAEAYFDCGLMVSGPLGESRLERALDLLPKEGVEPTVLLEWEFYFRLQKGDLEAAAALADDAPRRLGLFLEAWLARERGACPAATVELDSSGNLPCRNLPQELCAPPYAEYLLACGQSADDAATAALFLRSALPADPQSWDFGADGDRQFVTLLAEAEHAAGRFSESARLFDELAHQASDNEDEMRYLRRRRAETRLLLSDAETSDEALASSALEAWENNLAKLDDAVDRAITLNNIAVLHARLGRGPDAGELTELEGAIADLPGTATDLRLLLRGHLLALSIAFLERSPKRDVRDALERLRALREAFVEHEAALRTAPFPPARPGRVIASPGVAEPREPANSAAETEPPP